MRSLVSKARKSKHPFLLCHQNADPDAVCSAVALRSVLEGLGVSGLQILCPEGIGASTRQLLENLGVSIPEVGLSPEVDLAILVDTNSLDQLGETGKALRDLHPDLVVVDHHHPHPDTEKIASQMIVDEDAAAAAEVVFNLAQVSGDPIERNVAMLLLAALFVETKHFLLARGSTFDVAAKLVKAGADPRHLSEMLNSPMARSERIARLKAAERVQIVSIGGWIVASSELGSYQSSAARGLLGLGAHLALVGGEAKEKVRVNMRATEEFYKKTGVHLGRDLAIPVGKNLGGAGGGHPTAAGLSAKASLDETVKACVQRVRELLGPFQT